MISPLSSIIRKSIRGNKEPVNVISFPTHERYSQNMTNVNAQFYLWQSSGDMIKRWNTTYATLPQNHHLLKPENQLDTLPDWIDPDVVLSQNKFGQFGVAKQLAKHYGIPLISLEHCLPASTVHPGYLPLNKSMKGDLNLFISDFSRKAWGWNEKEADVIQHGVDTDLFKPLPNIPKKRHIGSTVNDWINRDIFCGYNVWKTVTNGLPVRPVGDTPGVSVAAKNVDELVRLYNENQIFINTSLVSPIPMSLLEAMSTGSACVSTATAAIPEIIKNGENGYLTNDLGEMRKILERLLDDPEECQRIGQNARKTILEKFSLEKFVENWNKILRSVL